MFGAMAAMMSGVISTSAMASEGIDASKIYNSKCKMCHAFDKKKIGPAFSNTNPDAAILKETITNGRKVMPKFKNKLSDAEIDAMVKFVKSKQTPVVGMDEADCACKPE